MNCKYDKSSSSQSQCFVCALGILRKFRGWDKCPYRDAWAMVRALQTTFSNYGAGIRRALIGVKKYTKRPECLLMSDHDRILLLREELKKLKKRLALRN